ncbi:MAG TPA: sulfatase/phosphatase domain-containing protein, partial [Pirellulales bacterium]|nr:sulfatase/phosphatase domain-containing protein [Pirellulales bacterium]
YFRMLTGIDHAIARVLKVLEQRGLADNTIIVYTADNGYYLGDRGFQGKWSHFDQSLRVPMVIYDPRLPREQRGRVIDQFALNVDLPATFLDWAGAAQPAAYEGRSLRPLVDGEPVSDWRTWFFCEHLDLAPTLTWEGVRSTAFMYARYFDQRPMYEFLHDLRSDPDELVNLAGDPAHADELSRMRSLCDREIDARGGSLPPLEQRKQRKAERKQAKAKNAE